MSLPEIRNVCLICKRVHAFDNWFIALETIYLHEKACMEKHPDTQPNVYNGLFLMLSCRAAMPTYVISEEIPTIRSASELVGDLERCKFEFVAQEMTERQMDKMILETQRTDGKPN